MSYGIFLLRFVDGEVVALDAGLFRRIAEPYTVAGGPEEGFSRFRAEDGGEAEVHHAARDGSGLQGATLTHVSRGAMSGVLARMAAALGASIVPQDGAALIFHEEDRRHLHAVLQEGAVVIAPTADAVQEAFDAV